MTMARKTVSQALWKATATDLQLQQSDLDVTKVREDEKEKSNIRKFLKNENHGIIQAGPAQTTRNAQKLQTFRLDCHLPKQKLEERHQMFLNTSETKNNPRKEFEIDTDNSENKDMIKLIRSLVKASKFRLVTV